MPVYHYECTECETIQEQFRFSYKGAEELELDCPGCGKTVKHNKTMKGIKSYGVIFKGKGWPDKDRKIDNHIKWAQHVMDEPACDSEVEEGKHMLRERESDKGYAPGTLTGDREQETVLVEAQTGHNIDPNTMARQLAAGVKTELTKGVELSKKIKDGKQLSRQAAAKAKDVADRVIKDKKRKGEVVEVKRTKLQGKEKLKERAKRQAQDRAKRVV